MAPRKPLSSQSKEIVFNLLKYFKDVNDKDMSSVTTTAQLVANATGFPLSTVYKISSEGKRALENGNKFRSPKRVPVHFEDSETHQGLTCYACFGPICGFRYSCVECINFDLCARCESMWEHDHHYMLRVPGPRPEGEVRAMAAEARAVLASRPQLTTHQTVQIKEELEIKCEIELEEPNTQSDPLYPDPPPLEPIASMIYPETETLVQQDHHYLNNFSQQLLIINPLVAAETVRTQTQSPVQSKGKVKAATEKRKLKSDQGGRLMVPLPFKMPKEEPLHADSGDTGDRTAAAGRGCASKEADFRVFTMQNKRDDDEESDSSVS